MRKDREDLVLYTTAICNLKCKYCYIDKNPALQKIDDILDSSFQGDYYFNFSKKFFSKDQLKGLQIWGGEPSIRLDRCYYTLEKLINYYPNFYKIMTSTNFTIDNWHDQFYGLLKILGKHPKRKFFVDLQLSLDGPEYINDASRGIGVTKKFTKTFNKFINTIEDNLPDNVELNWHFKPTLDNDSIRLLQEKEKIIEYYQFFERYYFQASKIKKENFRFYYSIPNTACPSPHTKQDGILFANFCKLSREISGESFKYFKFYRDIMPFTPRNRNYLNLANNGYSYCGGTCGTGRTMVGLLPYNKISTCHNGFCDLISDYKLECEKKIGNLNTALDFKFFSGERENRMTLSYEEFLEYEKQIDDYYKKGTVTKIGNDSALINLLARTGQIDKKYIDREEALKAAYFIQESTAYCIRDNINSTGCMTLPPIGLFKLLLNGAREEIEKGVNK